MASLGRVGNFSFFLESPNEKSFRSDRRRHRGFPLPVSCRGKSLHPDANVCKLWFQRVGKGESFMNFSWSGGRLVKSPPALGRRGGLGGGEDVGDDVDVDVGDEALQATIKKSKKVLAMQKDLLQQIVERRKLVFSIKDNIIDTKKEAASYNEGSTSFSSLGLDSTSGELDKKYKSNIVSETYAKSSALQTPEAPLVDFSGDLVDEAKDLTSGLQVGSSVDEVEELSGSNSLQAESSVDEEEKHVNNINIEGSVADALGLLREATSETVKSKTTPSLHTKSSEIYDAKIHKLKELEEENADGASDEVVVVPEEGNSKPPPLAGENVMNVIVVAAECAPWSKTGGLGDVAGALPKALARRGHRVMVVVPRYDNYSEPQEIGVHKRYKVDGQDMEVIYFHAYMDGVDFVFVDCPVFRHRQNSIYGGERVDILKRMILFCKAAIEVPWHVPCGGVCYGDGNLVFIANDWHTALLPVYLKAYYRDNGLMKYTRSVLVIHNIAHQGRGPLEEFKFVDVPEHYRDIFRLYDPLGGEHLNIFAAGLKAADRVVTVSHGYARELKTAEGGWGLNEIINENDWKLRGIVNGIDTEDWNPELDVHLKSDGYTNYSLETLTTGKPQCKAALQKELGLPVRADVPLLGFIGRLDNQKGVDLIAEAIHWIVGQDVQLVMLGTGRRDLEDMLKKFESQYYGKVRSWVGFSVKVAHRITAGSDILLMPSRFEPCGLNQLYAMTYGTIPVVHAVGGLRDTVQPFDPYQETGFGWTFDRAETNKLINALGNCFQTYWNYKNSWEGLQRRGMSQDLSWDHAAQLYEEVLVAAKYQW